MPGRRRIWAVGAVVGLAGLISGCAGSPPAEGVNNSAGLACVDDSQHCIGQRKAALTSMTSDASRKWVKEPATPLAHATGVRLFAFKTKKKDLNCDELTSGKREADSAPVVLRGGNHGLTPAQVSRSIMLASEVGRELQNEYNRRCKKG